MHVARRDAGGLRKASPATPYTRAPIFRTLVDLYLAPKSVGGKMGAALRIRAHNNMASRRRSRVESALDSSAIALPKSAEEDLGHPT